MLNPVLPAPRTRRIQTARNAVDVILNARSAADLRLYEWEDRGKTPTGKTRWYDTDTKKTRYQISKPGTGRGKKAQGDATAAPAEGEQPQAKQPAQKKQAAPRKPKVDHNAVGDKIEKMLGSDFPDQDVGALREELLSLTGTQLDELKKRFAVKGGKGKADVAGRIAGHVGGSRKSKPERTLESTSEIGLKRDPNDPRDNVKPIRPGSPESVKADAAIAEERIGYLTKRLGSMSESAKFGESTGMKNERMKIERELSQQQKKLAKLKGSAQPAPEAAPAPEKPARKPRAVKQPVRQPEPEPEPGKPGGRYDDMTREDVIKDLAENIGASSFGGKKPFLEKLNPRGYSGFPQGIDVQGVASSTLEAVKNHKSRSFYGRPTIRGAFESVKASHPSLTLDQFQQTLAELQRQKILLLGPYTQALSTIKDDDLPYVFPFDTEAKMYVGLGDNPDNPPKVSEPQTPQPAAAPTPAPTPAPAPAPQQQPRTPNAVTRNRLTAGVKPSALPAGKPRAVKQPVRQPAPTPEPEPESMDLMDDSDYGDSMDLADEGEPPAPGPSPDDSGLPAWRQGASSDDAHAQRQAEPAPSPAQKQAVSRAIFDAVGDAPVVDISELRSQMPRHLQGRAFDDAVIDLLDSREATAYQDIDAVRAKPGHIRDGGSVLTTLSLIRQSQQQTPQPAAAPTPAPTPTPAPAPQQPRTPNAVTRNRLTAGVKPSALPAGKPRAKRTGRGILNARNPVDVVLFARSPQQARPLLYAWLRTASKRNPSKTVWVNSTNPKDRRYQEAMPKQRATQSVESLPPQEHLQQILEAPYRVADYYLTSLQTRLRRMRPGALAALRMQFNKEG